MPADHPLTTDELEAMKARCERATDLGPWASMCYFLKEHLSAWDVDFIAHARTDLPRCIAEIERLTKDLEVAREVLELAASNPEEMSDNQFLEMVREDAQEALHKLSPKL